MTKQNTQHHPSGYSSEDFGTAPMLPLIFRMAVPSIIAQMVNLLYSIVDRIFIGHLPGIGTDALAGVGVCSSLILLISGFSMIVGGGGAPLAAISLGKGDHENAEKILGNGFFLLILFAILLTVPVGLFLRPILFRIGASAATIGYAQDYFAIYLSGTFFVMVSVGLTSFINTQGRPFIAMISVLLGAAMNTILDPLLMYGLHMGVKGAATATVISQGCSAAFILCFLFSERASLRLSLPAVKPDRKVISQIFSLGISPFVMSVTESLIGLVLNRGLAVYGDIYVSALTIMQSAMQFINIPVTGFTQGANPVISYNFGAKHADRVKQGFRIVLTVLFSFNLLVCLFFILKPTVIASFFTDDEKLIRTVCSCMPLFMAGMTIFGLQRACQNMFISMNEAAISLFIALLRKVILLVPLALILPRFFGVMGIFAAEASADGIAATLCTIIFAFRFPRILKKLRS